jgi:hypothetical protein
MKGRNGVGLARICCVSTGVCFVGGSENSTDLEVSGGGGGGGGVGGCN